MTLRASRATTTIAGVSLAVMLVPSRADAHLVTTGLGPIYDGVSHVFMSPEDLVPILAMAMLAGLNGPLAGRCVLFALTAGWLAGGVAGFAMGAPVASGITTLSFLLIGALIALDRRLPVRVMTTLAALVGVVHGWLNGASIAAAGRDAMGLLGIAMSTFVVVALIAALVIAVRQAWLRVAVRVAGSWVAAIGLLMLGWSLRAVR